MCEPKQSENGFQLFEIRYRGTLSHILYLVVLRFPLNRDIVQLLFSMDFFSIHAHIVIVFLFSCMVEQNVHGTWFAVFRGADAGRVVISFFFYFLFYSVLHENSFFHC